MNMKDPLEDLYNSLRTAFFQKRRMPFTIYVVLFPKAKKKKQNHIYFFEKT